MTLASHVTLVITSQRLVFNDIYSHSWGTTHMTLLALRGYTQIYTFSKEELLLYNIVVLLRFV